MRILGLISILSCALWGAGTLLIFGYHWKVIDPSDWRIESRGDTQTLSLIKPRNPLPGPRRPIQFALAETPEFRRVNLALDMRPRGRSLILVFAYHDPAHFDYAHLSIDTGLQQPVHNGIFHVFGGERVRISPQGGPAAFAETNHWYHVALEYNGEDGSVKVSVDGHDVPALQAVDRSFSSGRFGLGSFDEVGDFRDLQIAAGTQ